MSLFTEAEDGQLPLTPVESDTTDLEDQAEEEHNLAARGQKKKGTEKTPAPEKDK